MVIDEIDAETFVAKVKELRVLRSPLGYYEIGRALILGIFSKLL